MTAASTTIRPADPSRPAAPPTPTRRPASTSRDGLVASLLLAPAVALIAATGTPGGVAYFGNDDPFQSYVASEGDPLYDPETGVLDIDTAGAARTFDFVRSMAADGSAPIYANFFAEANEAFSGGGLGMMISSASAYPALSAGAGFDLRIAPAPYFAGGEQASPLSISGLVITTKDPERQAAVCEALLAMITPASVTATVEATGTIPLLPSVAEEGLAD